MTDKKIHVGIIPDGNRRWCKANGKDIFNITAMLLNLIQTVYDSMKNDKFEYLDRIKEVSVYILSIDNLTKRNDNTLELVRGGLNLLLNEPNMAKLTKVLRFEFVGELDKLPDDIRKTCHELTKRTKKNKFLVTGAIGYDPYEDSRRVLNGDESRNHQSDIDLIIRTGGEFRSSGFFPLKTLYSEWVYLEKFFPDLNLQDIEESIKLYFSKDRRFGK